MNILLVDDDRYIVKALQEKVHWSALGIKHVFSAYNMQQAQEIIKTQAIQLLISDIEMPRGSGLELLSWIRQENYEVQAIFLTNYADFNYAQKAIELSSFEYYLKPIEYDKLELIIKKAVNKINEKRQASALSPNDRYVLERTFWYDHLRKPQRTDEQQALFLQDSRRMGLQLASDERLLPIVVSLDIDFTQHTANELTWSELLKSAIDQVLVAQPAYRLGALFKIDTWSEKYFLLLKRSERLTGDFSLEMETLRQTLSQLTQQKIQLIVGNSANLDTILNQTKVLYDFLDQAVGHSQSVYLLQGKLPNLPAYQEEPFEITNFLLANSGQQLDDSLSQEMASFESQGLIALPVLKSLRLDITQKTGIYLDAKGILAHKLFQNVEHDFLLQRCYNSLEAFYSYLINYFETARNYIQLLDSKQSIAKILITYIDKHFTEDLNRKALAEVVYLSEDHLARLFKKETGQTLVNYITEKRLGLAKSLLLHSDEPIYQIASSVGYDNYSYFTKIFKKEVGVTPVEYRNTAQPHQR